MQILYSKYHWNNKEFLKHQGKFCYPQVPKTYVWWFQALTGAFEHSCLHDFNEREQMVDSFLWADAPKANIFNYFFQIYVTVFNLYISWLHKCIHVWRHACMNVPSSVPAYVHVYICIEMRLCLCVLMCAHRSMDGSRSAQHSFLWAVYERIMSGLWAGHNSSNARLPNVYVHASFARA